MNGEQEKSLRMNTAETKEDEYYARVQDYTGEEYTLPDGKETGRIANDNKEIVEAAIKDFFLENYKTEVIVHNIVGNVDGATVFVESVGEPNFYSTAIIPIDVQNEKILTDQVWSLEGEVERGIITGLYALAYQEEFANLDQLLTGLAGAYGFTSKTIEAIENTSAAGYERVYYFVTGSRYQLEEIWKTYLEEPDMTHSDWREMFEALEFDPDAIGFGLHLFMADENVEPSQEVMDAVVEAIEEADDIPNGSYGIHLHDNRINKRVAGGNKENSISHSYPDYIIKE